MNWRPRPSRLPRALRFAAGAAIGFYLAVTTRLVVTIAHPVRCELDFEIEADNAQAELEGAPQMRLAAASRVTNPSPHSPP
jgi:hypothetical protein